MYDLGSVVPLTTTVLDADGVPVVPDTAIVRIELPDGTVLTPSVTPAIPLAYDYVSTLAGPHPYRFETTGPTARSRPDIFYVRPVSNRMMVSLADAKHHLGIKNTAEHDAALVTVIGATTGAIERHTGKTVVRRVVTGEKVTASSGQLWLHHRPVMSLTSVDSGGTAVDLAGLDLTADWGRVKGKSSVLRGDYTVAYVAGMLLIPDEYLESAFLIVESQWQARRGATTLTTAFGGMEDSIQVPGLHHPVPNRALELLGPPGVMVA